jgi:hypothetical protein
VNETSADACSGHGTCSGPNNCSCDSGYTGYECELSICYGINETSLDVCSGHGQCVSANNCSCDSGYTGYECELSICYGINQTSLDVCSGHGQCISPDNRSCDSGYSGYECQLISCYGVNQTSPNVCSGDGECVLPNSCLCNDGYTGYICELNICYGDNETSPNVCSGHGICELPNSCSCNSGYTGYMCQLNLCYGNNQTSSNVCSGHGQCVSPNNRICDSGYTGYECQLNICYGVNQTDLGVCNSNGKCIAPDNCQCNSGFSGAQCDIIQQGKCIPSNSHILIAMDNLINEMLGNISLIDTYCGISLYSFTAPSSFIYLYNGFSQSFILLRNQSIYSVNSENITYLRSISPLIMLNNSAVFITSSSTLSVASLVPNSNVQLFSLNLYDNTKDILLFNSSEFISINGANDNRFITYDSNSGNIYALCMNKINGNISIVEFNSNSETISEYISIENFPSIEIVQAILFVNGYLHIMTNQFIYRVESGLLLSVSNTMPNFFTTYKTETDSAIYLNDELDEMFAYISKNEPVNPIFETYPMYLKEKRFQIIGDWIPKITEVYPKSFDMSLALTSWISLTGNYLNLNNQSSVILIDTNTGYSVPCNLLNCNSIGMKGNLCFLPKWLPPGIGYIEFDIQINIAGNNSNNNYDSGLSLIYYKPEITRLFPTSAISGQIISLYSYWYNVDSNITCNFTHIRTGNSIIITASFMSTQYISCMIPYFKNVRFNDVIQVSSQVEDTIYNPKVVPAFFYYINISNQEYYTSFDIDNLFISFNISEGTEALSLTWIPFDEATSRSLMNMTSTFSLSITRTTIQSIKPLLTSADHQLLVEFLTSRNQVGNVIEISILSSIDSSYLYGAFGIDPNGNTYISLQYRINTNTTLENNLISFCPEFNPQSNVAYSLILRPVRTDVELYYDNTTAFYEWIATQNINNNSIPNSSWRIDVMIEYGGNIVCKLNSTPSVQGIDMLLRFTNSSITIGQSIYQNGNRRKWKASQGNTVLSVYMNRIWIECQYEFCNLTTFITQPGYNSDNIRQANIIQQKKSTIALASIIGGIFVLLIISCLCLILLLLWRLTRKKKVPDSKLDAWKFEFVLDKNTSSLNDERYSTFARRMYKVENQDANKLQSIFKKKSNIKPFSELEMNESFSQVNHEKM